MYCRQCGAELRPGYVYCGSCGAATGETPPASGGYIDRPTEGIAAYRYAGFWRRFGAYWLDAFAVLVLAVIPMIVFGFVGYLLADGAQDPAFTAMEQQDRDDTNAGIAIVSAVLAWMVVWFVYTLMTTAAGGGWGKRVLGIRIFKEDTRATPGYGKAALRMCFPIILGIVPLVGSLLQLVDYLWMIRDAEKQTWHDKVAATVVAHA